MRHYLVGFALVALAAPAAAADKPIIAPSPAWVRAIVLPPTPKTDEAAIRLMLQDEQVLFEPGRRTVYSRTAIQLQTPQGLAAGNISLPWRPDVDVLSVHAVLIHRGDKVIDVLASGQTFTVVRREANLENASLDGVLTANIQPEGLEVGDILDVAISLSSSDPVLKGHGEQMAGAWNVLPIARARLRMQWPASMPIRVRSADAAAALKTVTRDGVSSVELASDGTIPIMPPKGAPMRYQIGRLVEASDFASWSQLAALMAPLYAKAAVLPSVGPLQGEVARIKALSADPAVRAEAALALVQDRVRYAFRGMDGGNYVPADAEVTWSKRFGDCKGKTALLLGLLNALGIEAEAVLVNTAGGGDGLDAHLPMATWFNHVLVRATIAGRTYWMDGTRTGDKTLDRLRTPPFGWGLPLAAANSTLVRMVPVALDEPDEVLSIRIDATGGLTVPAPTKIERLTRGDGSLAMNAWLSNVR